MTVQTQVKRCSIESIHEAAELLRRGEVVGMPTETVYGLAANAYDPEAVAKIFAAKGRPQDNPLIVHIASLDMLGDLVVSFPAMAHRMADAFWPGPLTMILPKSEKGPPEVTAGLNTVAVRMPSHPDAAALIRESGLPLAAPSANTSGRPSPTRAEHVFEDMKGKIPLILDGGSCSVGVESTVVLVKEDSVHLLRPGGVTPEQIQALGLAVTVDPAVESKLDEGKKVLSPGLKYKHYSPKADVILIKGSVDKFADYVNHKAEPGVFALLFEGEQRKLWVPSLVYGREHEPETQAAGLFDALRELDSEGAQTVYARCPEKEGMGLAVYNRMMRAAGFQVIEL